MTMSLDEFVRQTAASQLLTASELAELRRQSQTDEVEAFARWLVKRQKLTAYQAQQIYAGRGGALLLGNYEILDKLGQGGMGLVLKAQHRRMKRLVALKVISPAVVKTEDALRRFQREVEAAARLTHPNIVQAFDADEVRGMHFLVLEYVEGQDLASRFKQSGPVSAEVALGRLLQAARGLEYAHRQGVVHRDIKPANLLLDEAGCIKILDMGLARLTQQEDPRTDLTADGTVMGTIDYMAPEQAEDARSAGPAADVYSLGCTLHFLVCGRPVYGGETAVQRLLAHRTQPIPSLRDARDDIPPEVDALFARMVAKRPEDRFASMAEVIAAIEGCLGGSTGGIGGIGRGDVSALGTDVTRTSPGLPGAIATTTATGPSTGTARTAATAGLAATTGPGALAGAEMQPRSTQRPAAANGRRMIVAAGAAALLIGVSLAFVFAGWGDGPRQPPEQATVLNDEAAAGGIPTSSGEVEPDRGALESEQPSLTPPPAGNSPERDRWIARWALSRGGQVIIAPTKKGEIDASKLGLERLPPVPFRVRQIHLWTSALVDDSDLSYLADLPELSLLNLQGRNFTAEGLKQLRNLPALERLSLPDAELTPEAIASFRQFPNVIAIHFHESVLAENWEAVLEAFPRLARVTLSAREFDSLPEQTRIAIGAAPQIRHLNLIDIGDDDRPPFRTASAIHERNPLCRITGRNYVVGRNPQTEAAVRLKEQGWIFVAGVSEAERAAAASDPSSPLPADAWLRPEYVIPPGTAVAVEDIRAATAWYAELRSLRASQSQLDDAAAAELVGLSGLRVLELNGTRISDATAARLPMMLNLVEIGLADTAVTSAGLTDFDRLYRLAKLNLRGTQVDDESLQHLQRLPLLQNLDVRETAITEEALTAFRAARPEVRVQDDFDGAAAAN